MSRKLTRRKSLTWEDAQEAEKSSWLIGDSTKRKEKVEREVARFPRIRKQMGLHLIDLTDKFVLEIGGGPIGIIADLHCGEKVILDPLTEDFKKFWPCPYHIEGVGESIPFKDSEVDVVVISNTLDHCQRPEQVLGEVKRVLRAGGWLAVCSCINLAAVHPHPAHRLNLDEWWFHNIIDNEFETVHELTFAKDGLRYGWVLFEGRVGQGAFAGLYRKVTGY